MSLITHIEGTKWYDYEIKNASAKFNESEIISMIDLGATKLKLIKEKAEELFNEDVERFDAWYRCRNSSKVKWFQEVSRAGTFADRMSVVQLRNQISPVHSLSHVKALLEFFHKKGLRESNTTLIMLKELFINDLLPNRKLIDFTQRPHKLYPNILHLEALNAKFKEAAKRLILWMYESKLKECYKSFVHTLESLSGNAVVGIAENACNLMLDLLTKRPEQERFLLKSLVNKLGHPSRKVASRVANLLQKLVDEHFNMRSIVVGEVCQLLFRKNVSERAQYYAVHFLNHIYLKAGEADLSLTLVKIYFNLFKIVISKLEHEHTLIQNLITGLNRAIPYTKNSFWVENGVLADEVESLYSLVQTSKFSVSLNILKLLFNVHNRNDGLPDRFYSSFYRRLLSVVSTSLNRQFFAFFFKCVKNDSVEIRVRAFIKRIFQIALSSPAPEFVAASLLIVEMIVKERPNFFNSSQLENKLLENTWNLNQRSYDAAARNPLFSNADLSLDMELLALAKHYHPSVAIFARKLIASESINYVGDPLENFHSMNFLERFAFKNPKRKHDKVDNLTIDNNTEPAVKKRNKINISQNRNVNKFGN